MGKLSLILATLFLCGVATVVRCEETAEPAPEVAPQEDEQEAADPRTVSYSYSVQGPVQTSHSYSYQTVQHVQQVSHVQHVQKPAASPVRPHPRPTTGSCPSSHPFAYYNGQYCCKYTREKHYSPQGSKCDGSVIGFGSLCCYKDGHTRCPARVCKNYRGRAYPAQAAVGCMVDFYQHHKYLGARHRYTANAPRLVANDQMSSLRLRRGCCVTIYEHVNYAGRSKKICGDTSYIGNDWNDKVSSEKLQGRGVGSLKIGPDAPKPRCYVDFYQHSNYRGARDHYTTNVNLVRRNDDMSSLKVPAGCCAIIYEHSNYHGKQRHLCGSTGYVGNDWNDKVSSLRIVSRLFGDEIEEEIVENDEEPEKNDEEPEEADEGPEENDEEPEEADEEEDIPEENEV